LQKIHCMNIGHRIGQVLICMS
ncbi:hypothetical protein L459_05017, partial [Klebsiella pneumoniae BIDMC 23]